MAELCCWLWHQGYLGQAASYVGVVLFISGDGSCRRRRWRRPREEHSFFGDMDRRTPATPTIGDGGVSVARLITTYNGSSSRSQHTFPCATTLLSTHANTYVFYLLLTGNVEGGSQNSRPWFFLRTSLPPPPVTSPNLHTRQERDDIFLFHWPRIWATKIVVVCRGQSTKIRSILVVVVGGFRVLTFRATILVKPRLKFVRVRAASVRSAAAPSSVSDPSIDADHYLDTRDGGKWCTFCKRREATNTAIL